MNLNQMIIDSIKASLENNLDGIVVFEWLSHRLDIEQYPIIIIRDHKDKVESEGRIENHTLTINIDILNNPEGYEAKEMRQLIAKVEKLFGYAVEKDDFYFESRYLGRGIIGEHIDAFYMASSLEFEVDYVTEKWSEDRMC